MLPIKIFLISPLLVLECFATLELSIEDATNKALTMNTFSTVGTTSARTEQPFDFKWSILSFVGSGSAILACKWLWTWLEGKHLTHLSNRFIKSRSDPEKRDQIATDIVTYVNDCETGKDLMARYVFANFVTVTTMFALIYFYFDTVEYFQHPFSPSEFLNWTKTQAEERTDIMIKLFPRTCVFKYHSSGPSGTEQYADIYCTAGINTTLEYIYAATLIVLPIITSVHVISIILSVATVANFHRTTDKDHQVINNIISLSYGQRLLYSLISKNIDDNLWYAVLAKMSSIQQKKNDNLKEQITANKDKDHDLIELCPTETVLIGN